MDENESAGRQPGADTNATNHESTRCLSGPQAKGVAGEIATLLPVALLDELAGNFQTVQRASRKVAGAMKLFERNGGLASTFYTAFLCGVLDDIMGSFRLVLHHLERVRADLEVQHMDYRAQRLLAEQETRQS
jgi:hypothetical protein